MDVIKIAVLGLAGMMLAQQLKPHKPEFAAYLSLATGVLIFGYALSRLGAITDSIRQISNYIMVDQMYVGILIKVIGIAYICELASGLCKDAGYSAIAGQIEIFGKLSIIVMSLPILKALLETLEGL